MKNILVPPFKVIENAWKDVAKMDKINSIEDMESLKSLPMWWEDMYYFFFWTWRKKKKKWWRPTKKYQPRNLK